jgi:hypothetical protein
MMTNFRHWRMATWALLLWSGYMATWMVVTGYGPAVVALWWLAGIVALDVLSRAAQPLFRSPRGFRGPAARMEVEGAAAGTIALQGWEDEGGAAL